MKTRQTLHVRVADKNTPKLWSIWSTEASDFGPTSLSKLALTCSGLSDMTKSLVVSTEGAIPSPSGAYCTFLSISFTVLLLYQRGPKASTLDIVHFQLCSRLLPSDRTRWHSPFAYFGVLALSAERLNLKLHSTLLQKRRDENASPACEAFVSSLLTHEFESYLSDITGCWLQGHWARQVIGELQRRKTNVWTVWRLRQNQSFPLMCQHVNVCLWSMNQSLVLNGYSDDVTTLGLNVQLR